jgi:hypothetical protein
MAFFCEHGNEPSCYIKCWNKLTELLLNSQERFSFKEVVMYEYLVSCLVDYVTMI